MSGADPIYVDDPATGETYCTVARLDADAAIAAARRAREAQREWARTRMATRIAMVERFCDALLDARAQVARDLTGQMGKPIAQAEGEVTTCIARARHMASIAEAALADRDLGTHDGITRRIRWVPLGVVLDVAPWNYPLLTQVNVVVPAVLAGNAVLIKPAARTPLCAAHFADAFRAAGAPEGLVGAIPCTHDAIAALIDGDGLVDHVALTGSVPAGRAVYQRAAGRLLGCSLELGGADPAYIAEDADLDAACAGVVEGALYNAGQSCCAVERIYVHASVYDDAVTCMEAALAGWRCGDPRDHATSLGPLALPETAADMLERIDDAVAKGARLVAGGRAVTVEGRGRYFEGALLADCTHAMRVMKEEAFGPLVPVMRVDDDAEALARMNDSPFGLTASVWTADRDRALWLGDRLETGTVFQNRCDYVDPALPWTGVKESGLGSTLSEVGLLQLVRPRSYHLRG